MANAKPSTSEHSFLFLSDDAYYELQTSEVLRTLSIVVEWRRSVTHTTISAVNVYYQYTDRALLLFRA